MENLPSRTYQPGEFIFFEGDLDKDFYVIVSGQVEIFTKDHQGKKVVLATLGPGEVFGEMALLLNEARTATAQAMTACTVYVISEQVYQKLLSELPDWATGLIQRLSEKILQQNEKIRLLNLELRQLRQLSSKN